MAELAAAAAIIGISTSALQGIASACEFIDGMTKAPDDVKRIASELKELQTVLKSIPTQDDAIQVVRTITQEMDLARVIDTCDKACHDFVQMLRQWMPNPDDPSFVDRGKVWAHRKTIRTCRNIVRDTKATITLVEVVAVKRLQVETLRRQGMVSDNVAALLYKEATDQALKAREESERTAKRDAEQDEEEDHETLEQGQTQVDAAGNPLVGDETVGVSSVEDFEDVIRKASSKGIQLSKAVVKQQFGTLEMLDNNEFKQGVAGQVKGEVDQSFGNVKVGSGNKVVQGMYEGQ